jgi:hypothetical protein
MLASKNKRLLKKNNVLFGGNNIDCCCAPTATGLVYCYTKCCPTNTDDDNVCFLDIAFGTNDEGNPNPPCAMLQEPIASGGMEYTCYHLSATYSAEVAIQLGIRFRRALSPFRCLVGATDCLDAAQRGLCPYCVGQNPCCMQHVNYGCVNGDPRGQQCCTLGNAYGASYFSEIIERYEGIATAFYGPAYSDPNLATPDYHLVQTFPLFDSGYRRETTETRLTNAKCGELRARKKWTAIVTQGLRSVNWDTFRWRYAPVWPDGKWRPDTRIRIDNIEYLNTNVSYELDYGVPPDDLNPYLLTGGCGRGICSSTACDSPDSIVTGDLCNGTCTHATPHFRQLCNGQQLDVGLQQIVKSRWSNTSGCYGQTSESICSYEFQPSPTVQNFQAVFGPCGITPLPNFVHGANEARKEIICRTGIALVSLDSRLCATDTPCVQETFLRPVNGDPIAETEQAIADHKHKKTRRCRACRGLNAI